jgi:predicted Fe-Mo cluster-binding NifX family protein
MHMRHAVRILAVLVLSVGCGSNPLGKSVTVIAVASDENNATSFISNSAERSPYYLIFADTGELLDVLNNPYSDVQGDVVPAVLALLAQNRVDVIVAAWFSPTMISSMKARGIRYIRFEGVAKDAVDRIGGRL